MDPGPRASGAQPGDDGPVLLRLLLPVVGLALLGCTAQPADPGTSAEAERQCARFVALRVPGPAAELEVTVDRTTAERAPAYLVEGTVSTSVDTQAYRCGVRYDGRGEWGLTRLEVG